MKDKVVRVSVPGRIIDYLWSDDEFYRDVTNHKKVSTSGKFPKCDQWCDETGFHMAFALAGYSPQDVCVSAKDNEIQITGLGNKSESSEAELQLIPADEEQDEYPVKTPKIVVQQGIIVRGIARRNFRASYFINPGFDPLKSKAVMKNGLLEIFVPRKEQVELVQIKIEE